VEATKQKKRKKGGKNPKPEEQEGMPQHQHCPPVPTYIHQNLLTAGKLIEVYR
jgi:hypothetical protein